MESRKGVTSPSPFHWTNYSPRLKKLNTKNIETLGFDGKTSREPTVIGWMPSAQIYFRVPNQILPVH